MELEPYPISTEIIPKTSYRGTFSVGDQPTEVNFAEIDTEISLYIGESVIIKDHGIKLKFVDVLHDSRCPSDVECIWEGTVSLMINIQYNSQ
ncbi:MAG: hypothetical protein ACXADA_08680, partial [Candidatus Hodarchaeales archaeon]